LHHIALHSAHLICDTQQPVTDSNTHKQTTNSSLINININININITTTPSSVGDRLHHSDIANQNLLERRVDHRYRCFSSLSQPQTAILSAFITQSSILDPQST